jgi:hypothetical protein
MPIIESSARCSKMIAAMMQLKLYPKQSIIASERVNDSINGAAF